MESSAFWKFCDFGYQRQIADLALNVKGKNKYNALAPLNLESKYG